METYNEKQIKLNREILQKRDEAKKRFLTDESIIRANIEKARIEQDYQRTKLQLELDEVLAQRLKLKRDGLTITNETYMQNIKREREIQQQQHEVKMEYFDTKRQFNHQLNILQENYRDEKMKIDDYKAERLLQIERERKELLSLANENKED